MSPKQDQRRKAPAHSPLSELLSHIAGQAPHKYSGAPLVNDHGVEGPRTKQQAGGQGDDPANALNVHEHFNIWPDEPPETDYFHKTWARLGTATQLSQSQRQVPENAGPLNSSRLIHRALLLMQDQSPGYLQHFLSYVDTLSWIEHLNSAASVPGKIDASATKPVLPSLKPHAPAAKKAARSAGTKKPPRKG